MTLVELMTVLVVASVIAAIAFPSYREHVKSARRSAAHTILSEAAARQEQYYLNNKSYTTAIGVGGLDMQTTTDGGYYAIALDPPDPNCPLVSCYRLVAAPQAGTSQEGDSCGALSIDSDRVRLPAGCW